MLSVWTSLGFPGLPLLLMMNPEAGSIGLIRGLNTKEATGISREGLTARFNIISTFICRLLEETRPPNLSDQTGPYFLWRLGYSSLVIQLL